VVVVASSLAAAAKESSSIVFCVLCGLGLAVMTVSYR